MNNNIQSKTVLFNQDASSKILSGVEKITDAVITTLGPKGCNVLIENGASPIVSKDGITVARSITLKDPFENLGASIIKNASFKTLKDVGDGTTSVCVLTKSIYKDGLKLIGAGYNPVLMKRGIDKAVNSAVEILKLHSNPITDNTDILKVATLSANWDEEIGSIIAQAMEKVGPTGVVNVTESKTLNTTLTTVDGMQFGRGFITPYFANNSETGECILEDAYILLYDKPIKTWTEIMPVLKSVAETSKPILLMADGFEPEVLNVLVMNSLKGNIKCCAIVAPGYAEIRRGNLEDIAALTGGQVVAEELGLTLDKTRKEHLGRADKIIIDRHSTTIIGGRGSEDAVNSQINKIQVELLNDNIDDVVRDRLTKRLARLTTGIAVINVGGASDMEVAEKKMRIDDALQATKAAAAEGISPGGTVALIRTIPALEELESIESNEDEKAGIRLVISAIKQPLQAICRNAGVSGESIIEKVMAESDNIGYNAATNKIEDLVEAGVIEPTKIARITLQNAASAAGMLLTSRCAITQDRIDPEKIISVEGLGGMQ